MRLYDSIAPSISREDLAARYSAAAEAFAEFGSGETNGFTLGDFEVRRYAVDDAATGEDMATRAALRELADTGMAFCGVR